MLKKELGFTVVETLVAITLSAVALGVGFQLLVLGEQLSNRTETLLAANGIAFAKIQEYENKQFDNIAVGSGTPDFEIEDFSADLSTDSDGLIKGGTAKVYSEFAPNSGSLKKLTVVVDFNYGSRTRKIEYGTYIQLGGVGR